MQVYAFWKAQRGEALLYKRGISIIVGRVRAGAGYKG